MDNTPGTPKKPGGAATAGAFFLCWLLGAFCCAITSLISAQAYGFAGYSVGGFGTFIAAICCMAYYRSSGKLGTAALIAAAVGAGIGVLAVQLVILRFG